MNETMEALLERRSTRHYTEEPVSEAALAQILEAGLWAPTARNRQEVKIAVARDPAWRRFSFLGCCHVNCFNGYI